ncbi:MAG: hypothetical protein PHC41_10895 [Lachnospiraceae bacterium]|nr:hypothetical protein [Lachnospiraceae bacterium]MDD3616715.1 hypothetical protein [Lachnospiraceae bacterium]
MDFKEKFDKIMADYRPAEQTLDYDSVIDDSFKSNVEEYSIAKEEQQKNEVVCVPFYLDKDGNPQHGNPYTIDSIEKISDVKLDKTNL